MRREKDGVEPFGFGVLTSRAGVPSEGSTSSGSSGLGMRKGEEKRGGSRVYQSGEVYLFQHWALLKKKKIIIKKKK